MYHKNHRRIFSARECSPDRPSRLCAWLAPNRQTPPSDSEIAVDCSLPSSPAPRPSHSGASQQQSAVLTRPMKTNRPSIAIFCGEHHRYSIGTRGRSAQLPTRKAYRLGRSWGWQIVWKPMPYFRRVRNISNRFAAGNAAAMPS